LSSGSATSGEFMRTYTVSQKTRHPTYVNNLITSRDVNRFSKFFTDRLSTKYATK